MKGIVAVLALAVAFAALPAAAANPAREQKVNLTVTKKGFEPATVKVKAGQPVRLLVTRKEQRTCATELVLKAHGIHQKLPLGKTVEIRFTPKSAGTLRYACAMDMIAGNVVVE